METRTLDRLDRAGGHPVLDFVNTVNRWPPGPDDEYLHGWPELLQWSVQTGLIDPGSARRLGEAGPQARARAFRQARVLREALHALLVAVARGEPLPQAALDELTATVQRSIRWRRLVAEGDRVCCGWDCCGSAPESVLGPIAWQAMVLLEDGPLQRIKECPPPEGCGWLFLDVSRNRSRQWCSMRTCGNTAKVRRFRRRHGAGA